MESYKLKVTFYKANGKYYMDGFAITSHYYWDSRFKQDIVNSQDCMTDGWQGNFLLVIENTNDDDPFAQVVHFPEYYTNLKKEGE